ncbi:hypothetical protein ACFL2B_00315 [Patescibacteria group bacterium]
MKWKYLMIMLGTALLGGVALAENADLSFDNIISANDVVIITDKNREKIPETKDTVRLISYDPIQIIKITNRYNDYSIICAHADNDDERDQIGNILENYNIYWDEGETHCYYASDYSAPYNFGFSSQNLYLHFTPDYNLAGNWQTSFWSSRHNRWLSSNETFRLLQNKSNPGVTAARPIKEYSGSQCSLHFDISVKNPIIPRIDEIWICARWPTTGWIHWLTINTEEYYAFWVFDQPIWCGWQNEEVDYLILPFAEQEGHLVPLHKYRYISIAE